MPTFTSYALLVPVKNFEKARNLYVLGEDGLLHKRLYPSVFPWDIAWEVLTRPRWSAGWLSADGWSCDHYNRDIFDETHSAGRIVLEQLKGCKWMRPISLEAIKNAEEALKSAQANNKLLYGSAVCSFSIKCAPIILQVLQGARSIIENGGEVVFWCD